MHYEASGEKYEGNYKKNQKHGLGTYYFCKALNKATGIATKANIAMTKEQGSEP